MHCYVFSSSLISFRRPLLGLNFGRSSKSVGIVSLEKLLQHRFEKFQKSIKFRLGHVPSVLAWLRPLDLRYKFRNVATVKDRASNSRLGFTEIESLNVGQ